MVALRCSHGKQVSTIWSQRLAEVRLAARAVVTVAQADVAKAVETQHPRLLSGALSCRSILWWLAFSEPEALVQPQRGLIGAVDEKHDLREFRLP